MRMWYSVGSVAVADPGAGGRGYLQVPGEEVGVEVRRRRQAVQVVLGEQHERLLSMGLGPPPMLHVPLGVYLREVRGVVDNAPCCARPVMKKRAPEPGRIAGPRVPLCKPSWSTRWRVGWRCPWAGLGCRSGARFVPPCGSRSRCLVAHRVAMAVRMSVAARELSPGVRGTREVMTSVA